MSRGVDLAFYAGCLTCLLANLVLTSGLIAVHAWAIYLGVGEVLLVAALLVRHELKRRALKIDDA